MITKMHGLAIAMLSILSYKKRKGVKSNYLCLRLLLLVFLSWGTTDNAFAQCPNTDCDVEIASGSCPTPAGHPCSFPNGPTCTADDVKILDVYLASDAAGTCLTSSDCENLMTGTLDVFVCIVFCSNNMSNRNGIYVGGNVVGQTSGNTVNIDHCFDVTLVQNVPQIVCVPAPGIFPWDCTESIVLENAITVWGNGSGAVCPTGGGNGSTVICSATTKSKCRCYGEIIVTTPLTADFTFEQCLAGNATGDVTFEATEMGGLSPYSYSWDFGDMSSGTGNPVSHSFAGPGPYTVELTVSDASTPAQEFTISKEVILQQCCSFDDTCPNDIDLGTYNCSNINNIPDCPTTAAEAAAAPYNIPISNTPCGTLEVICSDNGTPEFCATQDYTITRSITIFDDLNSDGQLDMINEEFKVCDFTIGIEVDDEGPVFDSQPANISDIDCDDQLPVQETLTATDACGTATVTPSVDNYTVDQCGGYSITYRWVASDNCVPPNQTVVTKTFNVRPDTEGPVFDSQPADISDIDCDDQLPVQETLTATDACGTATVTPSVDNYTVDQCGGYSITYRWVASDNCVPPNQTVVTKTFNVRPDTEGPVFDSQPADISDIDCDDQLPVQETLTATDACGTATVTPSVDNYTVDQCGGYSITYRWVASDNCVPPNQTVVTKTFNVRPDTEGPVFDSQPADISDIDCDDQLPVQETLTATDACGTATVTPSVDNYTVDQCGGYSITYRWVASDNCVPPNQTVVTKTFNVRPDTEGPVFDSQPADISDIDCDDQLPVQETLTATDACGTATVTPSVDNYTVDQCGGYSITYRWVASDNCVPPNQTVVTKTFNVRPDTEGPVFDSQPANISDIDCDDQLPVQETLTATDACGTATVTPSVDNYTVDQCGGYSITYRWVASDNCVPPNQTVVTKTFNVRPDTEGPVFDSQPADISDIDCDDQLPVQETLTATDACGTATVTPSVDNYTVDQCGGYSITYRWVASDNCVPPNQTVVTKTFNVRPDTEGPVFDSQPADISDIDCDDQLPVQETLTATDACGTATVTPSVDNYTVDQCGGYSITYRWVASDNCVPPNQTVVTKTFNVRPDTEGPVFDSQPADISDIDCDDQLPVQETLTATDACGTATVTPSVDNYTVDQCGGYSITYRWVASDNCVPPNQTVVTKTFNVRPDTEGPVFDSQPADISDIDCDDQLPVQETLTATDACGTATVTPSVDNYTVDQCGGYSITYRWVASDNCVPPNQTVVTKTFNVRPDTEGPVFDSQPADISDIDCDDQLPVQETLTATDACGTATVTPSVDNYTVDQCGGYSITYRWVASDNCVPPNQTVVTKTFNVRPDTEGPVFDSQPADISDIDCDDQLPVQETLTATDACGTATVTPSVDNYTVDQCGGYSITYRWVASDNCVPPNQTVVTKTFNVRPDTEGPVFDSQPANISDIDCDDQLPVQETLTATDACGTATVTPSVDNYTVDQCGGYSITYRWVASDNCVPPNQTVVTKTFNVRPDTEGPVFDSQPANISDIDCDDQLPVQETLTATDACGTATVTPSVDNYTVDQCGGYSITYRWVASDNCVPPNQTVVTKTFNVRPDTEGPVFDSQPADISDIDCDDQLPVQETLTATDACGTATVTPSVDNYTVDQCGGYSITYRWVASDNCVPPNQTVVTKTFNVRPDTEGPVFDSQPADISDIDCDDQLPVQETLTATDACGTATVTPSVDNYTVDQCGGYSITYRWVASDNCVPPNQTVVTKTFNVRPDTEGPVFDSQPADILINCRADIPNGLPLGWTDNCSGSGTANPSDQSNGENCPEVITRIWSHTDACGNPASVSQTITVMPTPITVSCPADPDLPACASQSSIMYAYLGWVNGFKVSGGCNPSSNIADIPPLPNYMCGEAVNLSFEFKAYDDCTRDSCMATFTVAAAPQLFCQAPDPKSKPACASTDDFEEWKLQFTAGGGCSPTISYNIVINGQPVSPVSNLDNLQPPSMCGDSIWIQITVSDRCFQTLSRSSYYAIAEDTTKPEILDLESGSDLGCNPQSFPAPNPDNITADDDCGIAEIIIIPPEHDVVGCDGRYSYGYQVMDNCGNMSDIHVVNYSYTVDNDPPEFMPPAQILVLECTDPVPNPVEPLVRDACGDPKVVLMSEVRNDRSDCPFVGEVVRTWMATDGCGNTSTWDEVIGIQDNTTPVFAQLPPDICEDRAMTFEEFKYMVFQPLPIEGGCEPLLSEDPVIEFDCGACRYVITYNFQNDCGYAISHTQYVCIHVMPLSCSIAGLNELVCGEEERLAAVVSGGAGGNTYSWAVASGDWTIISPVDEPTIEIRAGTGESKVILTVTDQAGCISTCEYILSCGDPEGCSFSENFYGQDGLKSCYWKDTYEQIRHVLLNGDVTIGIKGQRSFTATHGDEYCIIDFLPGSGAPAALLSGDGGFVSCKATNIQKKANGVSNNSLASEALTMALNFGLDSNFAKIRIIDECFITVDLADCMSENPPVVLGSEDTTCLPVSIFDILGEKWTISDLFNLANQELAGINTGVDLEDLTTAMHYLNVAFEECKRIIEFGQFPNPDDLTPDPKMWDNGKHGTCKVKVSPNPVAYFTTINVTLNRDRDAQISIINTNSDVVAQYKLHGKKGVNHLNLNLYNYQRGLYTVMVISEDLVLTTKMLKVY